ncbi:carbonic anhydrase [Amaricoccus sp.]|uniref:carbonic anhydrase n=1 Tax=Amaricoccus sp. TaxID=1872485 RepID=UPI00260BC255|nr:carbonic anhydrase [Amaricoccus sp.]HRO12561.1 carbonic anhydrase [Amaricoccus sp.]
MLQDIFDRNRAWAAAIAAADPDYFARLAALQNPEFFWIGCSDSRVPANVVAGLQPGEVFVHRNVANVVHSSDMNLLATLEFAVEVLKVRHVIVCGHYGCGGVRASVDGHTTGLAGHWIEPIRRLAHRHAHDLARLADEKDRLNRLAELNVAEGVARIAETPILRAAWERGQRVTVHGLIYGIADGRLRDMRCTVGADVQELAS